MPGISVTERYEKLGQGQGTIGTFEGWHGIFDDSPPTARRAEDATDGAEHANFEGWQLRHLRGRVGIFGIPDCRKLNNQGSVCSMCLGRSKSLSTGGIKILTWNCNGALRRKWSALDALDADLLIVQECEDPALAKDAAYLEWAGHYVWTGPTKNKGIGVFARRGLSLKQEPLALQPLQLFLPCRVNDDWPLLATWTMQANSPTFGYIGQLWKFLQAHSAFLGHPLAMLAGDLNSNACWDKWDRWWNHSDVVHDLGKLGLTSTYHRHFDESQGQEARKTFFLHRNPAKGYHIDYVFAASGWGAASVSVEDRDTWLALSDHLPVVATFLGA